MMLTAIKMLTGFFYTFYEDMSIQVYNDVK